MLRVPVLIALALAFAGCLGGAPEEASTDAIEPASVDTAASAGETMRADAANATPPAAPVLTPVSYAGSTPAGFCVFPAGVCEWPVAGSEDWHLIDVQGEPQHLGVTITFGEQAPGMEFYAALCKGETEGADCTEYTTGASPLVLEYDLKGYGKDAVIGLSLGSVGAQSPAGMAFGPADFSVEGILTTLTVG